MAPATAHERESRRNLARLGHWADREGAREHHY